MEWDEEQVERTYIHTRSNPNSPSCGDDKLGTGLREAGPEPHPISSRLLKCLSSPIPYTVSLSHCYIDYILAITLTYGSHVCAYALGQTLVLLPPINTSSPGTYLEHPTGTRASDPILLKAELWWSVALRKGAPALVGCYKGSPKDHGLGPYSQSLLILPSCLAA